MRLENWGIVLRPEPYLPPELWGQALNGEVYGHPEFPDGTSITTSPIEAFQSDNVVLTKNGNFYELGVVAPEYEELYPNARERLFKSLQATKEENHE